MRRIKLFWSNLIYSPKQILTKTKTGYLALTLRTTHVVKSENETK